MSVLQLFLKNHFILFFFLVFLDHIPFFIYLLFYSFHANLVLLYVQSPFCICKRKAFVTMNQPFSQCLNGGIAKAKRTQNEARVDSGPIHRLPFSCELWICYCQSDAVMQRLCVDGAERGLKNANLEFCVE